MIRPQARVKILRRKSARKGLKRLFGDSPPILGLKRFLSFNPNPNPNTTPNPNPKPTLNLSFLRLCKKVILYF